MLIQTQQDLQELREVVREEVRDEVAKQLIPVEQKIDKVLKIVTTTQQELVMLNNKLERHISDKSIHHTHSRKLDISSPIFT